MQELVGRLTALDPEASESLRVIAYFDALVDGHAGIEVLLRGAAILSGCAAGFVNQGTVTRVDDHGTRVPIGLAPAAGSWPERVVNGTARAWIERTGAAHANDEMILERLGLALAITLERSAPVAALRRSIETVLDRTEPTEARAGAAARLRLDPAAPYRVHAVPPEVVTDGLQTVAVTAAGPVRAVIRPEADRPEAARAGIGLATDSASLHSSWASAVAALRMTGPAEPVILADDLGALLLLAEAADAQTGDQPDVAAIRSMLASSSHDLWSLEVMVASESLRAASAELGLHHSTLQARAADISKSLRFDIRSPSGRTRLAIALRLYLLSTNRFG
jgi:hypothetical protein